MRVALFSDIHGNRVALEAALDAIALERPDHIICLGDVAYGPQPQAVLERVRGIGCPVVTGNGDDWHLHPERLPAEPTALMHRLADINAWILPQLSPDNLAFLGTFQPTVTIPLGGDATLLCVHGSPRHYMDSILATTPDERLDLMLTGHEATLIAGGHTHVQMVRRFRETTLVNVGSVGLPYAQVPGGFPAVRPPHAEFALLTWGNGEMRIELRHVPVDAAAVRRMVRQSEMPHADWYFGDWQ